MDQENHLANNSLILPNSSLQVITHEKEETDITAIRNRIFLNHVDLYNARHITEYLTDQNMGGLHTFNEELGGEDDMDGAVHRVALNAEKYECVGTMKFRFGRQTEDIAVIVPESDSKQLEKEILGSRFVMYDITNDPKEIPKALKALDVIVSAIEAVKEIGPKTFKKYGNEYVFILISNVLTWGKTKPVNKNNPDIPFTEADYRKRKASPNYGEELACEREVILRGRKYKDALKTYVICCGIPYGFEQDNLLIFFKMAWENKDLPIFLPGNNYIPLVHIQDVAKVLHAVIELQPKKQYILVVEQIPCQLSKIIRALAKSMGQGVKEIVKEEAFLYNSINQHIYDIMTLNLKMEPAFILDELGLQYRSDYNLIQNMNKIVMEFRESRNLLPMTVVIHGPVFSGRTTLANHLVDYYGLHYINKKTMIDETRQTLRQQIDAEIEARRAKLDVEEGSEEVDEEGNEEQADDFTSAVDLESLQNKLEELETTLENNDNMLPDDYLIQLMRRFLASNICQNQGYVLDSFPKTMKQCKALFGDQFRDENEIDGEDFDDEEGALSPGKKIVPQYVISLSADDEYLIDIMMNHPESGPQYEEETMLKRLKAFRDNNVEDNSPLNFFDEHEIHPIHINIMTIESLELLFNKIHDMLGPSFGFEASLDEQDELMRCQDAADRLREEQSALDKEIMERKALENYEAKMEERIRILDELQREEEKLLTVQCEPLRHYLMMHIFPTLTKGLLEVARIKPNDPVDYLAEYLFKFNPEGKMFDPTYTRRGEVIQQEKRSNFVKKTSKKKLVESCNN